MRRWLCLLIFCGFTALLSAGCHTAGVCDCDDGHCATCGYGNVGHYPTVGGYAAPGNPMTKIKD